MSQRGLRLGVLTLSLLAAGCAISPNSNVEQFAESSGSNSFEILNRRMTSTDALVLPVVHDRQRDGPSCGAHALASVVNYWRGPGTMDGRAFYSEHPPIDGTGYSMAELLQIARAEGLLASAVRMPEEGLVRELEAGRPVLVPVRVPSIYVQKRIWPGGDVPVFGLVRNSVIYRASRVSEFTDLAMVNHYLLVIGHDGDHFVVLEPVMGYRTISFRRLERYRDAFDDAAIVFSSDRPRRSTAEAPAEPLVSG
jgi:predicted double-glycine peptidase